MNDWLLPAGKVLMVGLEGTSLDAETARRVSNIRPGGIILFKRNLDSPEQTTLLLSALAGLVPGGLLVALDQEGGRVSRLAHWLGPTPTASALASAGEAATLRFGEATAQAMRSLGFNLDFAPVVDLCLPGSPNGVGDRSFGTDPHQVAGLAGSFLAGLQRHGVAGCLKHFPGLGGTSVDSHVALPTCTRGVDRLQNEDLLPYRLLAPSAAAVMVGHAYYPSLSSDQDVPASLSPTIIRDWLRERLRYPGMVVSDDLEMGAIGALDPEGRGAVAAITAGCDLLLYCHSLDRAAAARDALAANAVSDGRFARRLEAAARAVTLAVARWPTAAPDLSAWDRAKAGVASASRLA